ncbi:uroporphyrinogen-III C-methyltransferase [Acidocella aminolytica]|uniref:uroporphyrinogen-III C-methyltransferase n=1 Tax=Acidocella aminolytica 101 = DSM 11237 TaxID=1120923 RepID=A0A0D6PE82_9PROT|nr:uroporphyrinogen-III C-methyltransferase [Acidocella aminolytica]GAN80085.1 precorrin-4 C11/uroporphyrin-III C/uroporphyrinogen-III C-methyltransferase [Acidocella aminolytica 101 = DSM 11237]GBQ43577.1 uroporphyrinogen-III methylase [Acidocella aminolytica 101 = DSM 11237]SHE67968.1 uroporphyrinogen-III C-methyltransferase [Acidocella aminolytica 101 = DSM 11237]
MSRVFLAGAGPGNPDLLTVRALRLLQISTVILHDSLVSEEILALANPAAQLIDVGKRCGRHSATQDEICALLVQEALASDGIVLRLKGGDPMIFGRATEEMQALEAAGIAYEIVPGITAALAASASLKRSLTQRLVSRAVHFVAGHAADGSIPGHDFAALAQKGGTLAVYMGAQSFGGFAAHLVEGGLDPATPALAIENVSRPDERIINSTAGSLPGALREAGEGPVLILVGDALAKRHPASLLAEAFA